MSVYIVDARSLALGPYSIRGSRPMTDLLSVRLIEVTVPLLAAVIAWFFNERRKRSWEEYLRKEENYKALLQASRGFYDQAEDTQKKHAFLVQVDLCWLYCPDDVIQKAYGFLETVKTGADTSESQRAAAFGEFALAIRKDLLKRRITNMTALRAGDFRLFKAR